MRNSKTNYTLVGAFVLLAFGTLLAGLYALSGGHGPVRTYYTELRNVSGVEFGTPVTYAGYPVGQVESVSASQTARGTRFRIALAVREDWRIPDDSLARVVSDGLLSAVSIDIEEGGSDTPLPVDGSLRGIAGGNVFSAMHAVAGEFESLGRGTLRPMLERLHGSVETLAEALDATAPQMLGDLRTMSRRVGEELPAGLARLNALSSVLNRQVPGILEDLQVTSAALRTSTPPVAAAVRRGARRLDRVLSERNVEHVERILDNLDHASADVGQLVGRLDSAAASTAAVLSEVDTLIANGSPLLAAALTEVRSSLSKVSETVDAVSHHLEGTSRNMHEFSRRIRDNPSALILSTAPQETARP